MRKYKLAVLADHPIQYQAPFFRYLAADPQIDLQVYFCRSDFSIKEILDKGYGVKFKWDVPLLEGYKYKFLPLVFKINPAIAGEIFKNNYDAILIFGYAELMNWLAFTLSGLKQLPIMLVAESNFLYRVSLWKAAIRRMVLPFIFRRISAFLQIGSQNGQFYRYYGVPARKLFLVPYSVDNDYFSQKYASLSNKRAELKNSLGIPANAVVLLYAGRIISYKRPLDLLLAFEKANPLASLALIYVGDGKLRGYLESYVKEKNVKNVFYAGFKNQGEIVNYYALADIFILPASAENWGLVINEAMNFALPIIASNRVGACSDLVIDGENGFLYNSGDIQGLKSRILLLAAEPGLREKMGRRSREIINSWSYKEGKAGVLRALEYICKK